MASRCTCVGCDKSVVMRLQAKLNNIQKDMLGFFCTACIIRQCGSTHKGNRK